jgi:hypothetical protein
VQNEAVLITASCDKDANLRSESTQWLRQMHTLATAAALEAMFKDDPDEKVKREAETQLKWARMELDSANAVKEGVRKKQ